MSVNRVVLLDNEAVQALRHPAHRKHRRVIGYVLDAAQSTGSVVELSVAVPAAVRVEAGWDRTAPSWAFINRLPIADVPLDAGHADAAAGIARRTGVSVAYAHIGAAIHAAKADHITVLTSDPADMRKVAEGKRIRVVTI